MTPIDGWLHRQAAREQRVITLEDALLGNRTGAYALYRLRYFALRCGSSAVVHGIRLTLLQYIFSHQAFLTTLLLHAIAGLVTSFWWGALEVLRARVRHLLRDTQRRRIPEVIGWWLTVAAALAAISLILPAGWIVWEHVHDRRPFDVLQFYIFAIGFRLAADLVTLTFHSGVYAVRRVYRPLPAMVAVELASVLAVLALWPWLGRWSFPIAVLVSTLVSAGLVVRYATRLYRLFDWLPLRFGMPQRSPLGGRTVAEFVAAGLSYAVMKLDAFLMLAMFHSRMPAGDRVSLFVFFVAISPAIQAGFDWAQLLYFDLKKLHTRCLQPLRQRYERSAFRVAWVVGVGLWGLACLLGTAITRRNLGELYWLIGPFFLARSFLALAQIQAFSSRRYRALLTSGALLLATMFALQVGVPSEVAKLLGLASVCLLVAWLVRNRAHGTADEIFERRVLPLTEWLERVQDVREPVRVRSLQFRTEVRSRVGSLDGRAQADQERWRLKRMAQRIAKRVRGNGAVTILYPAQVAWYEVGHPWTRTSRHGVLQWGGGLIESITSTRLERNGAAALQAALSMHALGGPLRKLRSPAGRSVPLAAVTKTFTDLIPPGVIYSPDAAIPEMLTTLSSRERRRILVAGVQFARHLEVPPRRSRFDVTSFCADGQLKLIFIVDRKYDRKQRTRWRALIKTLNLEAALGRTATRDTAPAEGTAEGLSRAH